MARNYVRELPARCLDRVFFSFSKPPRRSAACRNQRRTDFGFSPNPFERGHGQPRWQLWGRLPEVHSIGNCHQFLSVGAAWSGKRRIGLGHEQEKALQATCPFPDPARRLAEVVVTKTEVGLDEQPESQRTAVELMARSAGVDRRIGTRKRNERFRMKMRTVSASCGGPCRDVPVALFIVRMRRTPDSRRPALRARIF